MKINNVYLTFGAVLRALQVREATSEDLDSAIFCTTDHEMEVTAFYHPTIYDPAAAAVRKAVKENRVIYKTDCGCNNPTTFQEVNDLLQEHGAGSLTGTGDRKLFEMPMYCAVPSSNDGSFGVHFAPNPLPPRSVRRNRDMVEA